MTKKSVKLSRKDFQFIAETIKLLPSFDTITAGDAKPVDVVRFSTIVSRFADALAATNPQFDRDRFVRACNGECNRKAGC
ncbi:MAG TPA: hypothetical protein VK302_00080 [Terriglobales bacterium]|nr:hypothetical protein [Terriglobales bacterium]